MTLLEAVKSNPSIVTVPENTILAAFIGRGVDHTEDYVTSQKESIELISADLYVTIAETPDFSEGDLSIKHNPKSLLSRARNIYLKYGDDRATETGLTEIPLKVTKVNNVD